MERRERGRRRPFLGSDAARGEGEDIEAAVADEAEVGGGGAGDAGVVEGGVFDGVAVEAFRAVVEHRACVGRGKERGAFPVVKFRYPGVWW